MTETEKKNVFLTLHKNFVRTDIEYTDQATGELKTFNQVTLPKGTTIDGIDVGCYQFSPLFVNASRFRGENFRDIPLLADREVWLKRTVLDGEGNPVLDDDGKPERDTVKVMPQEIKDAVDKQRSDYLQAHAHDRESRTQEADLSGKAQAACNGAGALEGSSQPQRNAQTR
ncbi:DNA gyrase [Paraeggerthella sp.]|uniref:DNA gyrase n=1 Tax=Paraeggerthella sp. TaxID=2897350 RepID=UPI003A95191E